VKKSLLRTYDKLGILNGVELILYALTHRGAETSAPKRAPLLSRAGDCIEPIQVRVGGCTLPVHSDN
jgi:hypothetical protein